MSLWPLYEAQDISSPPAGFLFSPLHRWRLEDILQLWDRGAGLWGRNPEKGLPGGGPPQPFRLRAAIQQIAEAWPIAVLKGLI